MLSPFPELFFLTEFASFVLRVALGLVLFLTSFHQLVDKHFETLRRFVSVWPKYGGTILWFVAVLDIVIGLSFVAGIYTQYTALVFAVISFSAIFSKKYHTATNRNAVLYVLMFAISLSLLVTGAGHFAFDIRL